MVLVQKWPFLKHLFLRQYRPWKCLLRYSRTKKKPFVGYKNDKIKKWKNWHFSTGVNPWFWSKNGHFSNFFLLFNIGQEKVFVFDILQRKHAFLGYKKRSLKSRKIAIFPKGLTFIFGLKMIMFPTSFFRKNRPLKFLLRYFKTKKRLSRL